MILGLLLNDEALVRLFALSGEENKAGVKNNNESSFFIFKSPLFNLLGEKIKKYQKNLIFNLKNILKGKM
jgi:hypothetical protein